MTVPPLFSAQPRHHNTLLRSYLLATLMTGLTILGAHESVRLPFTSIPFSFEPLAVMLTGLLLGSRWGAVAQAQFLLIGLLGAPVFAGHLGGPAVLVGVTAGYLWSYPLAAFAIGWIAERARRAQDDRPAYGVRLLACLVGLALIYASGCSWLVLMFHQPLGTAIVQGALIFLPWDIVKVLIASGIATGARRGR